MTMKNRSKASIKKHGEGLIKIGEEIHTKVILGIFVTPLLFLAEQLFGGNSEKIDSYLQVVDRHGDFIVVLGILLSLSVAIGIFFKNYGYSYLDESERKT